ncbi:TetR family transcriptional regulator [Roseovarius sp. S1116L3]|uniref:TetR family transcriptional regulator n=1 Tax=Roseovarius roseus TaxID=3342636 RepID=UPI0037269FD8
MERNDARRLCRRMAPDARYATILDASQVLFMERGYEAATVANLLNVAGIAKGGFHYHFTAKEDLLTGVISRMTAQGLTVAEADPSQEDGNALAKQSAFRPYSFQWEADIIGGV